VKWDGEVSVGAGGAQKGAGGVGGRRARVRARWSTTRRGEGGTDRGSHGAAGERERASGGNSSMSGEAGPQGREGRGVRGRREPTPTAWPH
jgi:hypothetical protein